VAIIGEPKPFIEMETITLLSKYIKTLVFGWTLLKTKGANLLKL
jgi:hypothetical protein